MRPPGLPLVTTLAAAITLTACSAGANAASPRDAAGRLAAPAPLGEFIIDPRGRYCFRAALGWKARDHDVATDSIELRHGKSRLRFSHAASCPLSGSPTGEEAASSLEMTNDGSGRFTFFLIDGRYGDGRIALYERDATGRGAREPAPVFGCVDVESGWMTMQGRIAPGDVTALTGIVGATRVDCSRLDPDEFPVEP